MSKHKHVETAAHATHAVDTAPPEAAVAAPVPSPSPEVPVIHAAAVAPEAAAVPAAATPAAAAAGVASTLYGVGMVWAQKGIGLGKTALEGLARALDRGAKLLGDLQTQIKANADKTAA